MTEKCESTCDRKTCRKRHQQLCKFGLKCRRLETCEYKHEPTSEESGVKAQIKDLEVKITKLMEENKNTNEKMLKIESELKSNLKNAVQEGIKGQIISELKEKLKEKVNVNKEQNVKLIKKEQESNKKDHEINILKQNHQKCDTSQVSRHNKSNHETDRDSSDSEEESLELREWRAKDKKMRSTGQI